MAARLARFGAMLVLPLAGAARAHTGFVANELYAGMLHPLLHFGTILPLLAIALWLAFQPRDDLRRLVQTFFLAALVGTALGLGLKPLADPTAVMLPLALVLGLLVAWRRPFARVLSVPLVALVALLIALANTVPVQAEVRNPLLYGGGLLLIMGLSLLHVAAPLLGREQLWITTGARILGSWTATAALLVLVVNAAGLGATG